MKTEEEFQSKAEAVLACIWEEFIPRLHVEINLHSACGFISTDVIMLVAAGPVIHPARYIEAVAKRLLDEPQSATPVLAEHEEFQGVWIIYRFDEPDEHGQSSLVGDIVLHGDAGAVRRFRYEVPRGWRPDQESGDHAIGYELDEPFIWE